MIQSPELQSRLAELRAKSITGDITEAEMIEAFRWLRSDRSAAQAASSASKSRKAAAKAPVDTAALKADLLSKLKKA